MLIWQSMVSERGSQRRTSQFNETSRGGIVVQTLGKGLRVMIVDTQYFVVSCNTRNAIKGVPWTVMKDSIARPSASIFFLLLCCIVVSQD